MRSIRARAIARSRILELHVSRIHEFIKYIYFLGIPLYDGTGIFVDKELIDILDHYSVELGNLVDIFQALSLSAPTTDQGKFLFKRTSSFGHLAR
jgi:hypothetical protein